MTVLGLFRAGFAGFVVVSQVAVAQSAPAQQSAPAHKKSPARSSMAVWSPDAQQALGVSATDFKTAGLNRLTQAQLEALENLARSHPYVDPRKHVLSCPVKISAQPGRVRVLVTVAGDDPTGERATEILQAVRSVAGVDVVTSAASSDRALHVVIQEQTLGKRTIGYTASYVTGTPCVDESGGKKTDVELKGQLGTYTDPKGADLARDLAGMLDQDLQPLRAGR